MSLLVVYCYFYCYVYLNLSECTTVSQVNLPKEFEDLLDNRNPDNFCFEQLFV